MTQRSNANFDTLAAAVPAPYGPLTRVTDINTAFDYDDNSDAKVEATSALNVTVFISYNQLNDAATRDAILFRAHAVKGINAIIDPIQHTIKALNAYLSSLSGPGFSDAEALKVFNVVRTMLPFVGMPANNSTAWEPGRKTGVTQVISGTDASRTATLMLEGDPALVVTFWGDGNYDIGNGPHTNTFAADGDYVIQTIAIGPGGVAVASEEETVDVP